ncbi:MAG: endonuclease/exonuclease/phosphatase family protein [Saprospiraceae bacterium]|nr:endonuclease/exonuclease/phosphatase family protein [Lewinella sp.]
MGRLQRIFRWSNVILIFLTLFSYLSPYIHPGGFWPFSVMGLFYPVLLVLLLLSACIWLIQQKYYALLTLGCILLGWGHFTSFIGLHLGKDHSPGGENEIKVMSYNVFQFRTLAEDGKAHRWPEEDLLSFYQKYQPDIWCIQEFPSIPKRSDHIAKLLTTQTPLKYTFRESGKGVALFSRYPLKGIRIHYFNKRNSANGYLIADVEIKDQTYRVFGIHLQSNTVSQIADDVAANGHFQEKETWVQIKGMIGRYRRTAAMRSDQALEIKKLLDESPYPIILCGDFNDVPLSHAYHILSKDLIDGFQKKGKGIGTTFRGSLPALRIDYILSSPALEPLSYRVLPTDRSDHYPVLSILRPVNVNDP